MFGDAAPRNVGSGWISGILGVFLGATAAGAVLILYFPDLLTTEDLRGRYPLPLMRSLIELLIGAAFLASWSTDLAYFFVNHVGLQFLTFLTLWPATALADQPALVGTARAVSSQPVWIQVIELMLFADLVQYWVHRGFHRVPALWRFHAIHHSIRELDWLAGSRLHLVDVVVTRALVVLPAFVLGFSEPALYAWLVIIALHGMLNHVNMRFRLRPLEHVLVTPRFHYWHHAVRPVDRNFAVHLPWIDQLFGTHHLPDDRWPDDLGIAGHPVPPGFVEQLAWPLRLR